MKTKRLLMTALLVLFAVVLTVAMSSCGDHEHSFSEWKTVSEASCTSAGLEKRDCECGYSEYTTKEALAHSFGEWQTVTEPGCTSIGLEKRECECGYSEYNAKEAVGHTEVIDEAISATCTEPGKTEGKHCEECGTILVVQNIIPPHTHSYDEGTVVTEATCDADGVKKFSCTNEGCDAYYEESFSLEPLSAEKIFDEASEYIGKLVVYAQHGHFLSESVGVILSEDGVIVVNNLFFDNAYSAEFIYNGEYYEVQQVLAYSEKGNVAVLKIDATGLPTAKICMTAPKNGEVIYTVGTPSDVGVAISEGIISNANCLLGETVYIQHDASFSNGVLGGPLLNRFGELIGINAGFKGDDEVHLSTWVGELEKLDYTSPMTVEEYGRLTFTVEERLFKWIVNYANVQNDNAIGYVLEGDGFYYSLGYAIPKDVCFVEVYFQLDSVYTLDVVLFLDNKDGVYEYYASITDSNFTNEITGFIEAATYTSDTPLTYDTFYGRHWDEAGLMAIYQNYLFRSVNWLNYCIDTYLDELTIKDFGFEAVEFDEPDAEALDKVNGFIEENGVFGPHKEDEDVECFTFSQQYTSAFGEDLHLSLIYIPETGKTELVIDLYCTLTDANGQPFDIKYTLTIDLELTDDGYKFDGEYYVYTGEEFVLVSKGWGYIYPAEFTQRYKLFAYEFLGDTAREDTYLADFKVMVLYGLDWFNYILGTIDTELTVEDFGFLFILS